MCLACVFPGSATSVAGGLCPVCNQDLGPDQLCSNDWCGRADRWFSTVWSIGRHEGALRQVIGRYKFREETDWARVLGRILLGFLDEHMLWFDPYALIIPMPAYQGPGARRSWDPVGEMVTAAEALGGWRWPFTTGLVTKSTETPPLTGKSRSVRRACAEGPLRRALRVADPTAVAGRRVLVIDDVLTEGSTLREVARALRRAGSVEVAGLALARQPWSRADRTGPRHRLDPRGGPLP